MRSLLRDVLHRRARTLAVAGSASAGHQICEALVPLAIGLAVDQAVDGGPPRSIMLAVGGILALFALLATGGGTTFWTITSAAAEEAHELRVRAAGRILADPRAGAGRRAGDLATVLVSDTKATAHVLRAVVNLVSGVAGLLVTVTVLLSVDPWLGLGIAAGVPALTLAIDRVSPWLEHRITAHQHASGLAAALAAELVHGLRTLRGFGGVPEALRRYRRASRESLDAALRGATASAAIEGAGLVANGLVLLGTAAAAGAMTRAGRISAGDFITVVAMASFAGEPVQRIATGIKQAAISRAGATRLAPLVVPENERSFSAGGPPPPAGDTDPTKNERSFSGVGRELAVGPGEMLGVVTTEPAVVEAVVALFAGPGVLVEPHAVQLFGRTLPEVLDTGRGGDQLAALAAVRAGNVGDVLLDGGVNLSGGQRQRVALARALVAGPAVLVLRDPLTAVDAVTEDAVARGLAAMRREQGGATVVISTSPLLLSHCDRVVRLEEAR